MVRDLPLRGIANPHRGARVILNNAAEHSRDGPATAVVVPPAIVDVAIETVGRYFEPLCGVDRTTLGRDHVAPDRYRASIEALDRQVPLAGKKLLEIGTGFGVSLAVMAKEFAADGFGIEPASEGFDSSLACARQLFVANGLDPARIVDAVGEALPFLDASFDVVYSSNVLEHTSDPARVLSEAFRVVRPGGIVYIEVPNYLAYYEGHYHVPQPPILWNGLLTFWVARVFGRDPAFARTLRTEVNPVWLRRALRRIGGDHPHTLHTLGERRFLDRLARPFVFETDVVEGTAGRAIRVLQRINVFNWIGRSLVLLQAHYPIVLIATRNLP